MSKVISCIIIFICVGLCLSVREAQARQLADTYRTLGRFGIHPTCDGLLVECKRPWTRTFALIPRGGDQADADKIQENESDQQQQQQARILGGSLLDALQEARSKARLLLVFLPAAADLSNRKNAATQSFDQIALSSLLSDAVYSVIERTFRGNKKSSLSSPTKLGSFLTWSSPHGSPNYHAAISTIKKLKGISPLGSKASPYLVVLYPAQVMDSTGKPKIIPRLLAQHHGNPPPSAESMASWLLSLRNRHKKLYASMHRDLVEMEFLRERKKGYSESVRENKAIDKREKEQEEKRLEMERIEKDRLEKIQARRKDLLASLPPEPGVQEEEGVITIALRFPDGKSGKRRFLQNAPLSVVFDWVDAVFGMERETVELSTMTGQKTYVLATTNESVTLKDAGLGKLAGLRVTERKTSSREGEVQIIDAQEEEEEDEEQGLDEEDE